MQRRKKGVGKKGVKGRKEDSRRRKGEGGCLKKKNDRKEVCKME